MKDNKKINDKQTNSVKKERKTMLHERNKKEINKRIRNKKRNHLKRRLYIETVI